MTAEAERFRQTADRLAAEGLEGLVAFNNGQNLFLDSNAVFVLSGVRPIAESAVVVDRGGAATLIVTPAWDAARAAALSRTPRTIGSDDLAAALAEALAAHRIDARKVLTTGLATLSRGLARRIEGVLGPQPRADNLFASRLARRRSPAELAASERATAIAERGYERMREIARPGMREFELVAELYCHMKELGAEDNFLLVSASQHNLAVRAAGRRVLDQGDIILSEITPCFGGQFAQICRTTVIGAPAPLVAEKFAILQEAMRRGQEAAVPGVTVGAVTRRIDEVFRAAGYGAYCQPPYMRVRGHGLGITSAQPGDITADSEVRLEEGMVFVMHPNQYLPETGYLMCGEPVVITKQGAKALSARAAELDWIAV